MHKETIKRPEGTSSRPMWNSSPTLSGNIIHFSPPNAFLLLRRYETRRGDKYLQRLQRFSPGAINRNNERYRCKASDSSLRPLLIFRCVVRAHSDLHLEGEREKDLSASESVVERDKGKFSSGDTHTWAVDDSVSTHVRRARKVKGSFVRFTRRAALLHARGLTIALLLCLWVGMRTRVQSSIYIRIWDLSPRVVLYICKRAAGVWNMDETVKNGSDCDVRSERHLIWWRCVLFWWKMWVELLGVSWVNLL